MKALVPSLALLMLSGPITVSAQYTDETLKPILQVPRSYNITKITQPIVIDGKDDEQVWSKAPWSEAMVDIEGKAEKKPPTETRFKLLWDEENLYVYCRFDEQHIWATLKEHDQSIFQDNALELFIDPDGDTHNYMEFQINAFNAVWDLMLNKPPRNGGPSVTDWDVKGLKKAVFINGTLNNPSDIDKYWGIELAIPLRTFRYGGNSSMPKVGSTWKLNLTRVQREVDIKDGAYVKRLGQNGRPVQPAYYCWSPQGLINFHYPERWGIVRFADESGSGSNFVNAELEQLKLAVWKYYYLLQEFRGKNGSYPLSFDQLKAAYPAVNFNEIGILKLNSTGRQFEILAEDAKLKTVISVDHESKFAVKMLP